MLLSLDWTRISALLAVGLGVLFALSAVLSFCNAGWVDGWIAVEALVLLGSGLASILLGQHILLPSVWLLFGAIQGLRLLRSLQQQAHESIDSMGHRTLVVPGGFSYGSLLMCVIAAAGFAFCLAGIFHTKTNS